MSDADLDLDDSPENRPELTREELIEVREAFFVFAKEDRVRPKDLKYVLRALGIMLNEEETTALLQDCMELEEFTSEDDDARPGIITLEQLNIVLRGRMPDTLSQSQILMAFATFDPMGNGFIETEEFKRCLTTYGEKMNKRELKQILKLGDPDNMGFYYYEKVAEKLAS